MNDPNDYMYRSQSGMSFSANEDSDVSFDDDDSTVNSSSNYSVLNSQTTSSNSTMLNDKRRSRNQNEKKRRDQFNSLIQGLGNLLNHPRKIDKATVLSETLYFFRNYNDKPLYNKEIEFKHKPFFLQNDEFMRFMIEFQNAFCLVFDMNGVIKHVSDDIMLLLGHYPKNIQNCSLLDFVDEKSAKQIKTLLRQKYSPQDPISFECRFKKGSAQSNLFESVKVRGFFKRGSSSTECLGHFNTIAKINSFMRINEVYPRDNVRREFVTEFSVDFKYTIIDAKATELIGYSQIELIGTSGYDYVHHDDLEKLIECHKKLIQNGAVPTISYRLRTKGAQWVWIQTRFQILTHQFSLKPRGILANNFVLNLNEMLDSRDMFDSTEEKKFFYTPEKPVESVAAPPPPPPPPAPQRIAHSSPENSSNINNKHRKTVNEAYVEIMDVKSVGFESVSSSSSSRHMERKIDESLESIFIKSYHDLEYRSYVLNQLKMKKNKIENSIRKHQEELKILEDTMENIGDDKKLACWVLEFQKKESNQNKQLIANQQHQQQQELSVNSSNESKLKNHGLNSKQSDPTLGMSHHHSGSSSNSVSENSKMRHTSETSPQLDMLAHQSSNEQQQIMMMSSDFANYSMMSNEKKNTNKNMNNNNNNSNEKSQSPKSPSSFSNEESSLVGDLMNLRSMMPNNGDDTDSQGGDKLNAGAFEIDDINPEIMEKLFPNYSFD